MESENAANNEVEQSDKTIEIENKNYKTYYGDEGFLFSYTFI